MTRSVKDINIEHKRESNVTVRAHENVHINLSVPAVHCVGGLVYKVLMIQLFRSKRHAPEA